MTARFVSFLAMVWVLSAVAAAAEPAKAPSYFPDKVGSKWTYKMEIGTAGSKAPALTAKVVSQLVKRESIDGVDCALLETAAEGEVGREHVGARSDGLYRFTFNGKKADPAVPFLRLPAKKGDAWSAKSDVEGRPLKIDFKVDEVELDVAGKGKIKTLAVTSEADADGQKVTTTTWYAADLGMVQQTQTYGERVVTLKLETFEAGK